MLKMRKFFKCGSCCSNGLKHDGYELVGFD